MTATDRLYGRLAPLAYDDANQGLAFQKLVQAWAADREILEFARDQTISGRDYLAWEALFDPDTCPAELLDWLAVFAGVVLPPSALTDAEKRSRIKQAAGRYRGTESSWVTEIQRSLTGSKSVRVLTFVTGDRWQTTIITRTTETPDPAAVSRTAVALKPIGILLTYLTTNEALIDEGTRTIDAAAVAATIDSSTFADVT